MIRKILTLSVLFFSINCWAALGAVSTATGGTGRGAVEPVDGILLNPAFLTDLPNKNFSFNYGEDQWALIITDNGKDSYFPAALQFVSSKNNSFETRRLGVSFTLPRWKKLSVGATVALMEYTDLLPTNAEVKYRQGVADLGATYSLTNNWGLGFIASKVGSTRSDLADSFEVQQTVGAGVSYTFENFLRLRMDAETAPENKTNRMNYMIGLENFLNDWVVFRIGYQNNNVVAKNYMTGGLGFAGPQFGLHYAYIGNTSDSSDQKHLFDLAIPF